MKGAVAPDARARRRGWATSLLGIGGLAITLRLLLGLSGGVYEAESDGAHFERIAISLLEGRGFGEMPGFKTAHRAPLQPTFLAAAYWVLGRSWQSGVIVGALLAGMASVATGALTASLGGRVAGLLAAVVIAVNPHLCDYSVRLWSLSEALFTVLLVVALAAWARAERGHVVMAAVAGMMLGLSALTRPIVILLPLVLVARWRAVRRFHMVVAAVAFVMTLAPWSMRNYHVFGAFVPVSTMTGIVLYQGFHPPEQGWGMTPWDEIHRLTEGLPSEVAVSDFLVRHTLETITADPLAALALLPSKLASLLNPLTETQDRALDRSFVVILVLGLLGAVRLCRRRAAQFTLGTIAYLVAGALVFYGSPRFRLPMEPLLVAFASTWVVQQLQTSRGRRIVIIVVVMSLACSMTPWLDRDHARMLTATSGQTRLPPG